METISVLRNFIIIENFFFINRSYLLNNTRAWALCNLIFITMICVTLSAIIYDVFYLEENIDISLRILQIFSGLEVLHLASAARSSKSFPILDMIDKKCSEVNTDLKEYKAYVSSSIIYLVAASLLDCIGSFMVNATPSMRLSLFLGTAANDAEIIFYTLLVKGFCLKLSVLEKLEPIVGAKIYGRLLIGTANLSGDFHMRVLMILLSIFFKTVVYLVLFVLSGYAVNPLSLYLALRELKAIYSVWTLCAAAAESDTICEKLTFNLTSSLVLNPRISKNPKSRQHNITSRWLSRMNETRPKYITGSILSIDLAVPFQLIDLGISYTLIVVQIYIAFF